MAIAFTPGQIVAQPDWEALVRQHGGDKPHTIRPRTEAEIKAAALAGEDDPAAQQHPIYRAYMEDGSYVEYRYAPNGADYQIVAYQPSEKFKQAAAAADKPTNVYVGTNPQTGKPTQVTEYPNGRKTYDDTQVPAAAVAETPVGSRQVTDAQGKTVKVTTYRKPDGTTYEREDTVQAAPEKPQVVPGTLNTTSPRIGTLLPDGSIQWAPNPNYQNPSPKPLTIPNTRTIVWDDGNGQIRTEKNPNYVKPSKLMQNPSDPRKWINVTEDDNGNPVILPVTDQTTIKPADLPVLQTKYGEIASGLAALAKDLNEKVARGEITDKERTDAFAAAHGQAETAVAEINSILDNSKAIWSGQVQQRGQTLQDTQGRRSYASDIARSAMSTGENIALHSGRGSGAAIASGVGALMRMGQRYAEGMGGFRESPEIALPAALQQAQGIGLPGFGPSGAPTGASGASGPPAGPGVPASGISNTTDAGGVPREYTPASSSVGSGVPPSPPPTAGERGGPPLQPGPVLGQPPAGPPPPLGQGQDLSTPPVPPPTDPNLGQPGDPHGISTPPSSYGASGDMPGSMGMLPGMGSALAAGNGYAGSPVAAGGQGVFDPNVEAQAMLGDGSDPAWAEAVRRAAAFHAGVR